MAITAISVTDIWDDFVSEITSPAADMRLLTGGFEVEYHAQTDRFYGVARNEAGTFTRAGWFDPLLVDGTLPMTNFTNVIEGSGTTNWQNICMGEWNRSTGAQNLYTRTGAGAAGRLLRRDPNTLQKLDDDPFPNVRSSTPAWVTAPNTQGYYVQFSDTWIIFETLGKIYGIGNIYDQGTNWLRSFIEIDIATGLGLPVVGIPGAAVASPHQYQEPTLFGDTVNWDHIQYVNDDDSTHINPKGYFLITITSGIEGSIGAKDNPELVYVRTVDWNPNGVSGTPNRVHKRITLTSRAEFDETISDKHFAFDNLVFHPISGRLYWISEWALAAAKPNDVNFAYRFTLVPNLDVITAPAPEQTPRTAGTTAFAVECLGTLGEKIPAVTVDFTLEGASTVLELLDTSGGPASAAGAVDYIPIDDDAGIEVFEDDGLGNLTLLVEGGGSDYTVNYTTGVITGVGIHWEVGEDYYVSYNHKDNTTGVAALGTLQLTNVASDDEGRARTRIRYADNDNLIDRFDKLNADAS